MIVEINLERVLPIVRFLSDTWIGIDVNWGRRPTVLDIMDNIYLHLNLEDLFYQIEIITYKKLGRFYLSMDRARFMLIYYSIVEKVLLIFWTNGYFGGEVPIYLT